MNDFELNELYNQVQKMEARLKHMEDMIMTDEEMSEEAEEEEVVEETEACEECGEDPCACEAEESEDESEDDAESDEE